MASICGLKNNQPGEIIRAVLLDLFDIENNHIYQDFEKYGASNPFWVMFSNLGLNTVPVEDEYPEKYDRLLCGGIWCIVWLEYECDKEDQKNGYPIRIRKLTPIQMPHVDIDDVKNGRKVFTKDE